MLLEFLVDVKQEGLYLGARHHVLLVEAGADAEVERLLALLLLWPLLEPAALAAQAQLDHLCADWHVLAALGDNALHVAALRSNQAARHLKVAVVGNLDVVPAGVLSAAVRARGVSIRAIALNALRLLLLRVVAVEHT